MKHAVDFREIARGSLKGKWPTAVLTGFVASLIGAQISSGSRINFSESTSVDLSLSESQLFSFPLRTVLFVVLGLVLVWAIVVFIIAGPGKLGYARFNLNLVDGKNSTFLDLFSHFHRFSDAFIMNFLMKLYIFLWSLLLIIPGIIKTYSYRMTPYILLEHPEMTASEAITESRQIMDGNKWRLFCLDFSFIGWSLLCAIPVGFGMIAIGGMENIMSAGLVLLPCFIVSYIGILFLRPYIEAAVAAFYRDVSGTDTIPPIHEEWSDWFDCCK